MVRKEKQIYRILFTLFNVHRRDVTLLSPVHVENILFDATCGLIISRRNEETNILVESQKAKNGKSRTLVLLRVAAFYRTHLLLSNARRS